MSKNPLVNNPFADRTSRFVVRDSDRYGDMGDNFGDRIPVLGLEHARYLARVLTNFYPGCDYLFTVEGDDE